MSKIQVDKSKLKSVVVEFLKEENVEDIQVDFKGTTGATDGYMGDINFVKVKCITKQGQDKHLDLVIKSGKYSDNEESERHVKLYFLQEIIVYTRILPAFQKFEIENNVKDPFKGVPKCYKCIEEDNILVMDNMKSQGYVVHDRNTALSWSHLKIVLEEFGKFHALSFAFQIKKEQEYNVLIKDVLDTDEKTFGEKDSTDTFIGTFTNLIRILKDRHQTELYHQVEQILDNDLVKTITDLLKEDTSYKIVSHIDTWNNNFMFLYDDNHPVKVKIIDWQMAAVRNSPIYDIAHFLYACSSPEDLNKLEDLLKIYYSSFSNHLKQLGCDPEEVFSFELLKDHWTKYSLISFWFTPYVIKQSFWNEKDAQDMEQNESDNTWAALIDRIVIQDENYYTRLIGVVKHFFNYKFQ